MRVELPDEAATGRLGTRLAQALTGGQASPLLVTLEGPLGAGKTSLVRAMLRELGHAGAVRSPTYTLLEPYEFDDLCVVHLDLYRLADPGELEYLGLEDHFASGHVLLVEWPDRAGTALPPADLTVSLDYAGSGRRGVLVPGSPGGQALLQRLGAGSDSTNH
jgi:tRNA threonylcarbamoyladenosine biosynthesis protein TsaE